MVPESWRGPGAAVPCPRLGRCAPAGAHRGRAGEVRAQQRRLHRPPQPRADLIRKHPFLLICSGRSLHAPGENRCSLSPDEHLGLGKWLHSALFRREKRILWLQTTLSVNILQLSARLSDDKPHAARRAANLRPYGYHFIVIFHGRNVNGRRLLQPFLTARLSSLTRLLKPPRHGRQAVARPSTCPPGLAGHQLLPSGGHTGAWEEGADSPRQPPLKILFFLSKIRNPAASPRIRGSRQGG